MRDLPITAPPCKPHGTQSDEAFTRHAALLKAERDCPALAADPRFQALRSEAWAAFSRSFEVA